MKLLILPVFLAGLGAGWFGLTPGDAAGDPQTCDPSDCRVSVECTPRGTCLVTCTDASGEIVCQEEIECDEPCEKACDKPCEAPSACTKR